MNINEQVAVVLEQLERCHTAMGDFFPHAGLLEVGGSKALLSMSIMPVLQDCTTRVRESLLCLHESPPEMGSAKLQMLDLWSSVIGLLKRLRRVGSEREAAEVNEAATLLYLACGTSWNYLCGLAPGEPPHNPQYVTVEPMLPLLKRCGRKSRAETDVDPRQLAQRLTVELDACLR